MISRLAQMAPKPDVILPETPAGIEPMCAVYSKRMLNAIEHQLSKGNYKIKDTFGKHRIHRIGASTLGKMDPTYISFFNINTPEDLAKAEAIELERGSNA